MGLRCIRAPDGAPPEIPNLPRLVVTGKPLISKQDCGGGVWEPYGEEFALGLVLSVEPRFARGPAAIAGISVGRLRRFSRFRIPRACG